VDSGAEPGFDFAGVAELAKGNALHDVIVTQNVSHCQESRRISNFQLIAGTKYVV
jgi:hypothetical protein